LDDNNKKYYNTNPEVIRNILTLRYDKLQKSSLSIKNWRDFLPDIKDPSIDFIEESIKHYIKEKTNKAEIKTIAIALSGGVDSTLILSYLKETLPDVLFDAISIKFSDSVDESKRASEIAKKFDINHHILYLENYLEELPQAINIIKLPFWDLHWYYVAKKAKSLSNYLASGDGGDELFAGYTFRYSKFLSLNKPDSTPLQKVKSYLECHERDRVPDQEKLFGEKINFNWNSIYEQLLPYFNNSLHPLEQVFLADYNGKLLYNFSLTNTRIIDHFNITPITPLLSEELVEYATHLPTTFKYDQTKNLGKLPLRKLLSKFKLNTIIAEEKLGFSVNTLNLWKSHGQEICKNYLSNARIVKDSWINNDWIKKYINRNELDIKYINKFLGLLAFEIWYRLFITKEMNPNTKLE